MSLRIDPFVWLALAIGLSACTPSAPATTEASLPDSIQKKISALDSLAAQLVHDSATVGVALGIQIADYPAFYAAYGTARIDAEEPVTPATRFGLASATKPFTALAIAQLVEAGQLSWNDSLSRFFPDFPRGGAVTIYHLLSHTSGIVEWGSSQLPPGTPGDWTTQPDPHRVLAQIDPLYQFDPGTHWAYSNTNYLLLGNIIEQVSGMAYADYLRSQLWEPLGMSTTAMAQRDSLLDAKFARGYTRPPEGVFEPTIYFADALKSVGGIASNVEDMVAFSKALFDYRIVSQATLDTMTAYGRVADGRSVAEAIYLPTGAPAPTPPAFMTDVGYGLGFNLNKMYDEFVISHSGGMPGYNAFWMYHPGTETHLVLLSNTDNGLVPQLDQLLKNAVSGG